MLRLLSLCATAMVAVVAIAFFAVLPGGPIEPANAYFQQTNIYSSGLVGTHTLALTFDDGPSAFTGRILDELAKYNVKATFFVLGSRAAHHTDLLERMSREGHVIGNHSLTQYPCINTIKVNGKDALECINKDWLQTKFIESVQKRGGEVMNARKNSSVFSAANAVKDHLRDWYKGTDSYVSMGVYSEGDYDIPKGVWTSLPVICKNFTYTVIKNIPLT